MKKQVLLLVFFILTTLIFTSCTAQKNIIRQNTQPIVSDQAQEISSQNAGKVLFIIAQNNFRDEELEKPKQILENAGYDVNVASITTDIAKGMLGARVKPDLAVKDANISDYALIVVVGGNGAPQLADYPEVLNLLSKAKDSNMKIGGICLGPTVLAKAGVLEGKQATVFKTTDSLAALNSGGASFLDQKVVIETNLVTANGPEASTQFGNELVNLLKT